jgi:thymidylate synthase (FAD)
MNQNTVELIGHYGSDEIHACSAWTSTSRELTDEKRGRIPKLLKQLADDGHHTPFEKSALHFLVTCDQASHIHFLKHRIGVSINGESARYKELKEDRMYIPQDWPEKHRKFLENHTGDCFKMYHIILSQLQAQGMSRKRAKESARFLLPYNSQIQLDIMFNWRSFYHFLGLRKKPNAQDEIHNIAKEMLEQVSEIPGNPFEHTIKAFGLE